MHKRKHFIAFAAKMKGLLIRYHVLKFWWNILSSIPWIELGISDRLKKSVLFPFPFFKKGVVW